MERRTREVYHAKATKRRHTFKPRGRFDFQSDTFTRRSIQVREPENDTFQNIYQISISLLLLLFHHRAWNNYKLYEKLKQNLTDKISIDLKEGKLYLSSASFHWALFSDIFFFLPSNSNTYNFLARNTTVAFTTDGWTPRTVNSHMSLTI